MYFLSSTEERNFGKVLEEHVGEYNDDKISLSLYVAVSNSHL